MTLHLNHITPVFVVQASDALVTVARRPHDRRANKNVIYFARDGILAIAYTGAAYVGPLTTDQWISFALLGERPDPEAVTAVHLDGGASIPIDIGSSVTLLVSSLTEAARNRTLQLPEQMQVICVGWQSRRGQRIRPVAIHIGSDRGGTSFRARQLVPRDCDQALTVTIGSGYLSAGEDRGLRAELRTAITSEASRDVLAGAIRRNSSTGGSDVVGPDTMTVILEPARFPHIPVAWIPAAEPAQLRLAVGETVPEHYGPLLVRAGMRLPPMIVAGKQSLRFGPFLIDYDPPVATDSGVAMAWEVQRREPRPR